MNAVFGFQFILATQRRQTRGKNTKEIVTPKLKFEINYIEKFKLDDILTFRNGFKKEGKNLFSLS